MFLLGEALFAVVGELGDFERNAEGLAGGGLARFASDAAVLAVSANASNDGATVAAFDGYVAFSL